MKHVADIIEKGVREHPELSVCLCVCIVRVCIVRERERVCVWVCL